MLIGESELPIIFAALCFLVLAAAGAQAKPKWQILFSGQSTAAWRGFHQDRFPLKCWSIENGSLRTVAGCAEADRVDIVTRDKFQNFELELEWRVTPGANSGIIYLVSEDEDQTWKTGPEMQVLDDEKHTDGKKATTSAGALYDLIAPTNKILRPVGQYNKARIVVRNNHVEHWLNGTRILQYELGSDALKSLIAQSKFKDFGKFAKNPAGYIALQHHGDDVWYRNIRIRTLAAR